MVLLVPTAVIMFTNVKVMSVTMFMTVENVVEP